jgi:hypothetical protein
MISPGWFGRAHGSVLHSGWDFRRALDLLPQPVRQGSVASFPKPVKPCIELFGAERCNFESNFPVDKMGTGYATLWNAFKRITAGCSQTEKLALYSGTAKRLAERHRERCAGTVPGPGAT